MDNCSASDPHYHRLSTHRQDSSHPAPKLLTNSFSFCTILPVSSGTVHLLRMNYGEVQTGKLMLEETPNHRVYYRNIPQTHPGGWSPADPRPHPHGIPSVLSLVSPLLPQSRSWAGKVCVKPSGWGWQHSCSRTFCWRNETPCWNFRWPVAADTAWQCDLGELMIPITAGLISGVYWISTDKDLLPCPLVGWEEESCQKLAGMSSRCRL